MSDQKKVLIDGRLLSRSPTGISRFIEKLIEFYLLHNCEVSVLVNNNQDIVFQSNINYIKGRYNPFNIFDILRLNFMISKIKFDIIQFSFYSGVFFKKKDVKYYIIVHDLMYRMIPNYFSNNKLLNKLKVKYLDYIVKNSCKNCADIFSDSESTKNDLNNCFRLESIVIKPGKNIWPEKIVNKIFNLEENSYYFYVGNNRKQKNLNFLIKAFLNSNSTKKLVLAGFESGDSSERIKYLGKVSEMELVSLYVNSFAFVFPSLYEGFGLPILEAMSFHCRIISSNAGSLSEFSEASISYFNPNDEASLSFWFNNENKIKYDPKSYLYYTDNLTWENYFYKMAKIIFNDKYIDSII